MVGADVAVSWLDHSSGKGYVHDYYITSKSHCSAAKGVCPDTIAPVTVSSNSFSTEF